MTKTKFTRKGPSTPTPGLVAGMVENINSWEPHMRLLIAQCIISGDVLEVSTHKNVVNRRPKYAPLAKPTSTTMAERDMGLWVPGGGGTAEVGARVALTDGASL